MGLVVLVICAPVLIPLIIIMFILALKGDEWFNHSKPSKGRHYYYYDDYDDKECDSFSRNYHEPEVKSSSDDGMFYGGIPMGDSTLYLTDDDDICDEFADEF